MSSSGGGGFGGGGGRDPFPMQSEEARRLAASVHSSAAGSGGEDGDGGASSSWNRMGTETEVVAASSGRGGRGGGGGDDGADGGAEALTGSKKKRRSRKGGGKGGGDIYEEAELDEQLRESGGGGGRGGKRYFDYAAHDDVLDDDDDFLDAPLPGRRRSVLSDLPRPLRSLLLRLRRLALLLHSRMFGPSLPPSEVLRTTCLASTLFFLIGGYWTLRSLKDPVLTALCGVDAIPKAKMLSVFVVLGVVSIYNRLLDVPGLMRHRLFYLFGTFYFVLFASIAVLLAHPTIGLPNQTPDYSRVLGWTSYCAIESFGSVMVSLFWSFANSNFDLETAKASYGLLVATAQLGSILGPTLVNRNAARWGVERCYFMGAVCMVLLQGTMWVYVKVYGTAEDGKGGGAGGGGATKKKKAKAGVLEGLRLFARHNYVKGIFAISCLFMVEVTIVDYTMKVLARDHFDSLNPCQREMSCWDAAADSPRGMSEMATAEFTSFMGLFGQATNLLSFALSLFGTSAVIRTLGLRTSLLLFPTLCLCVIIAVRVHPTLYTVFLAMMLLKANSYALNNPTKELLYQPTSAAVKYKAKSWIDIFGARGSKALGSVVTNAFSDSASSLIRNGSLVGMGVATFLIWNARFMGRKFEEYTESGYVVGGEDDDDDDDDGDGRGNTALLAGGGGGDGGGGGGDDDEDGAADGRPKTGVEMAAVQNETSDTSCALRYGEDDDEVGSVEEGQSDRDGDDGDGDGDGDGDEEDGEDGGGGGDGGDGGGGNESEEGEGTSGIARVEQV